MCGPAPRFSCGGGRKIPGRSADDDLSFACPGHVDSKRRAGRGGGSSARQGQGADDQCALSALRDDEPRGQAPVAAARFRTGDTGWRSDRDSRHYGAQAGQSARPAGRVGQRGDVRDHARKRCDERPCDARLCDVPAVVRCERNRQFGIPFRADRPVGRRCGGTRTGDSR